MTKTQAKCPVCENNEIAEDSLAAYKLGLTQTSYGVMKCHSCDLRWLNPRPSDKEYQEMYQGSDYFSDSLPRVTYEVERSRYYKRKCQTIQRVMGETSFKLLDVGTGTGEFIVIARQLGIQAEGIEISPWACAEAQVRHDIDLQCTDITSCSYDDATFDVVYMHHVLEHITQPVQVIEKTQKLLKNKGLFVLEVPYQFDNALEIVKSFLGLTPEMVSSPPSIHHPFFFSPKSLETLLIRCGFRIQTIRTFTLGNPVSETQSTSTTKRLIKTVILAIGGLFNKGDFIEIYARSQS